MLHQLDPVRDFFMWKWLICLFSCTGCWIWDESVFLSYALFIINVLLSNATYIFTYHIFKVVLIWLFNPTELDDLSDSFISGEEDNGRLVVSNKNINNEINGNWLSSSSNSIHEARLKAKAKRRLRKNSSRDSGRGDSLSDNGDVVRGNSVAPTSPKSKLLDRKSRLGKGRGLPKKGKSTLWGFFKKSLLLFILNAIREKKCVRFDHFFKGWPVLVLYHKQECVNERKGMWMFTCLRFKGSTLHHFGSCCCHHMLAFQRGPINQLACKQMASWSWAAHTL